MLHAGVGATHVQSFLSTIGVPSIHQKSLKRRERELISHIGKVAKTSCDAAIHEELQAMEKEGEEAGKVKYDMGWQKRGTGRSYDSSSGHGVLMGNHTGKVVGYDVRIKKCRVCDSSERGSKPAAAHNCQVNFSGSSKAMEPDVAESVIKEVNEKGLKVKTLIMDDDTTTIARVRTFLPEVCKWSDLNHTKKHLGNSLYKLANKHKLLTTAVIRSLQRWFSFAVQQNKNDPEGVCNAISQITPHAFGEHSKCGSWCGYANDPINFKHKTLPNGKDLTGDELRRDLQEIFDNFTRNSEKIAPAASTKEVESFNNIVASKAPKRCHYSGSESLRTRVDCAVAQKNVGHTYVTKVNSELGMSPGKISLRIGHQRDSVRQRLKAVENSRAHKKRKFQLKTKKSTDTAAKQTREGITYRSSIDLLTNSEYADSDVQDIPAPMKLSDRKLQAKDFKLVVFDLETANLSMKTEITQIAAVCSEHKFNQYVLPLDGISPKSTEVTGITCHGDILMVHGRPVPSCSIKQALTLFIAWLTDVCSSCNCVLFAHNCKFDEPRIMHQLSLCNLTNAFSEVVLGFCDTIPLFKKAFPGLCNYKQSTLVQNVLQTNYEAHNALADVVTLQQLLAKSEVNVDMVLEYGYSITWLIEKEKNEMLNSNNLQTLLPLVENKILSKVMAKKIAYSGLNIHHLYLAIARSGMDGIKDIFREICDGKPRVTKSLFIVRKVHEFLEKHSEEC